MSDATTFTTAAGFQLNVVITPAVEAAAREQLGVVVADLANLPPDKFLERFKRRLTRRDGRLFGLLYLTVEGQLSARGVEPERFAALVTHAHLSAALVALMRAIAGRYPDSTLAKRLALAAKQRGI